VFPFIEGASHSITDLDRPRLLEAVGRLHVCTDAVPADLPRRDSLTVPIRSARRLLRDNQSVLRDLWHRCDELADEVRGAGWNG
jgi:hypothetical protein